MVVAQLVEPSLPTPEVRGSNPVIGKAFISNIFVFCQLHWKDENKEKEAGNGFFSFYLGDVFKALEIKQGGEERHMNNALSNNT